VNAAITIAPGPAPADGAPPKDWRDRFYHARDGIRLHYREYGDPASARAPVLCLGGLTRNCQDFDLLARRLARQRRVVCPDLRGRGDSAFDPNWRNYRPEVYLDDLRQLMAAARLGHVIVIGTSLGGVLAMAMGVAMPVALRGVVLNDTGPEFDVAGIARIIDYVGEDQPQPDWETAARHMADRFPHLSKRNDDIWRRLVRNSYREGADGRLHVNWDVNLSRSLKRLVRGPLPDLWPLYRSLKNVPVLALRGAWSDVVTAAALDRMAHEKPDLIAVTVRDVGHAPTLEEPEAEAALNDFLADL
jgi:pimeloyl-ACP methyl ester carboxylesterase